MKRKTKHHPTAKWQKKEMKKNIGIQRVDKFQGMGGNENYREYWVVEVGMYLQEEEEVVGLAGGVTWKR